MNAGVFIIVLVLVVVYVAYPLVQNVPGQKKRGRAGPAARVIDAESASLLSEIELDYELGNLSEEDRREMIAEAGGSSAARPSEASAAIGDADEAIEREVARLRGLDIESKVSSMRERPQAGPVKCSSCGTAGTEADKFCGRCGTRMPRKSR